MQQMDFGSAMLHDRQRSLSQAHRVLPVKTGANAFSDMGSAIRLMTLLWLRNCFELYPDWRRCRPQIGQLKPGAETSPSGKGRTRPEAVGGLDRRRSSRKGPFAGDRESGLGALCGRSVPDEPIGVFLDSGPPSMRFRHQFRAQAEVNSSRHLI
jgi:hypothetical protein